MWKVFYALGANGGGGYFNPLSLVFTTDLLGDRRRPTKGFRLHRNANTRALYFITQYHVPIFILSKQYITQS